MGAHASVACHSAHKKQASSYAFDPENENHYARLGLSPDATPEEIKKAYRKASMLYHPDRFTDLALLKSNEEHFKNIKEAYETLSDTDKRRSYDLGNSETTNSSHCNGHCAGYMSDLTLEALGSEAWSMLVSQTHLPTKLNVSRSELDILAHWVSKGDSSIPDKNLADPYTGHRSSGFNSIQLSSMKLVKTPAMAAVIVRELGNRLDAKTLIEILETPKNPQDFGSFPNVKRQIIFELLRIYQSNRDMTIIPNFFSNFIKTTTEPRAVDLIVRVLKKIETAASTAVLEQIATSRVGWTEGSGWSFQDWTPFIKSNAENALQTRAPTEDPPVRIERK